MSYEVLFPHGCGMFSPSLPLFLPLSLSLSLSVPLTYYSSIFHQDMPKELQPNFVLDIETSELFIQAGLQDRVIQVGFNCVPWNSFHPLNEFGIYFSSKIFIKLLLWGI